MVDVSKLGIQMAHDHLRKGDFSAVELAEECLKTIEEKDKEIHAYLEIFDDVRAQAKEADKKIKAGDTVSVLTGIPIALKDNMLSVGRKVSAGSKILENYTAAYDATVVSKLKEIGVIFMGRTNLDEFAMGSSTENSAFGVTKNPHDTTRVPGGSSGGSAAAVSYGGALAALGSDTGGSIRQPASFCGVVGLKPTYGAVSRYGLIAMGSSLDQIGPFGKSVSDVALLFDAIRGHDTMDSTSFEDETKEQPVKKSLTLGVPWHLLEEGIDDEVTALFKKTIQKLTDHGHHVVDIELPRAKHSLAVYYVLMPAEASTNLARFDGVKYGFHIEGSDLLDDYCKSRGEGFGPEVRRRILLGTYVLSAGYYDAYYTKAHSVRSLITEDFNKVFESVDAVVTPTTPTPAFKIGGKSDPVSMYLSDILTVSANLTGMPALSVPMGSVSRDGALLPIGFQAMGPARREETLFAIGRGVLDENTI